MLQIRDKSVHRRSGSAARARQRVRRRRRTAGRPSASLSALDDALRDQVELLRPDRRRARDGDHAVALRERLGVRARTRSPARRGHARWTSASSVAGASRVGQRVEREADRARAAAPHAGDRPALGVVLARRRLQHAPSAIATRSTPASSAPGTCARSVVVITLWPPARSTLDQPLAPAGVELAHHVVEQHQRRRRRARRPAPRARRAAARAAPSRCWPREP